MTVSIARKRTEKELECLSKQRNMLALYRSILLQRGSSVISVGSWKHSGYSIGNNSFFQHVLRNKATECQRKRFVRQFES